MNLHPDRLSSSRKQAPQEWEILRTDTPGLYTFVSPVSPNLVVEQQKEYIGALPTEILSKIFEHSMTRSEVHTPQGRRFLHRITPLSIPATLLHVSARWRATALSIPSLWDTIAPSDNSVCRMERWLHVMPPVSFHLSLFSKSAHSPDVTGYTNPEEGYDMIRLFVQSAARWMSLSLLICRDLCREVSLVLQEAEDLGLPVPVRDLSIAVCFRNSPQRQPTDPRVIVRIPSFLKHLERLESIYILPGATSLLPWARPKEFSMKIEGGGDSFVHHLFQWSTTQDMVFKGVSAIRQQLRAKKIPSVQRTTSIPNLTSLTLTKEFNPLFVLNHLSLPALRTLNIAIHQRDHAVFTSFLARTPLLAFLTIEDAQWKWITARYPESGFSAPSDEDILRYLTDPHITRIPNVYIALDNALTRGLDIVGRCPLPRLYGWPLRSEDDIPFIGWVESGVPEDTAWYHRGGELIFNRMLHL